MFLAATQRRSQGYPGFANSHGKGGGVRGGGWAGWRWREWGGGNKTIIFCWSKAHEPGGFYLGTWPCLRWRCNRDPYTFSTTASIKEGQAGVRNGNN